MKKKIPTPQALATFLAGGTLEKAKFYGLRLN
jgi:hypothetical protein